MILKELINIEEKLLKFESENKFNIDFQEYINLDNFLKEIGGITNLYFILVKEYSDFLKNNKVEDNDYKNKLNTYNEKILNSDVNLNTKNIDDFITKYNIK